MFYHLYIVWKREVIDPTGRNMGHAQVSHSLLLIQADLITTTADYQICPQQRPILSPGWTNQLPRDILMTLDFSDFEEVSALTLKGQKLSVYGFVFSLALLPGQFLDIKSTFSIPWYPAQHHLQPWDTFYIKGSTSVGLLPRNAGLVSNGGQYPKRLRYCPMGICLKSQANI